MIVIPGQRILLLAIDEKLTKAEVNRKIAAQLKHQLKTMVKKVTDSVDLKTHPVTDEVMYDSLGINEPIAFANTMRSTTWR